MNLQSVLTGVLASHVISVLPPGD